MNIFLVEKNKMTHPLYLFFDGISEGLRIKIFNKFQYHLILILFILKYISFSYKDIIFMDSSWFFDKFHKFHCTFLLLLYPLFVK